MDYEENSAGAGDCCQIDEKCPLRKRAASAEIKTGIPTGDTHAMDDVDRVLAAKLSTTVPVEVLDAVFEVCFTIDTLKCKQANRGLVQLLFHLAAKLYIVCVSFSHE